MCQLYAEKKNGAVRDSDGNMWSVALNDMGMKRLKILDTIKADVIKVERKESKRHKDVISSSEDLANMIDFYARMFFPLAYALFLTLYFSYYLNL